MSTERCPDCFKPITINGLFCENLCRLQRENQRNILTSGHNMLQRMLEVQKTSNLSSGDRYVLQVEAWITKAANGQIDYEKLLLEDIELWDSKTLLEESRENNMDKDTVKSFIGGLSAGDQITINFAGDMSSRSGTFKVLGHKTGRGKGGSKLVELQALADDSLLTTGTPHSNIIMSLQAGVGEVVGGGSQSECNVPYERDLARSEALKAAFIGLRDTHLAVEGENKVSVRVESTAEFLAGTFEVTSVSTKRGRHGQMVLHLVRPNGQTEEIWSHRHSGVITKIDVTSTPRVATEVV